VAAHHLIYRALHFLKVKGRSQMKCAQVDHVVRAELAVIDEAGLQLRQRVGIFNVFRQRERSGSETMLKGWASSSITASAPARAELLC